MTLHPTEVAYRDVAKEIAAKRVDLQSMFARAETAPEPERDRLAKSIKTANGELESLINRSDALKAQIALGRQFDRQVPLESEFAPSSFSSGRSTSPRGEGPDWGKAVLRAAEEQSAMRGVKSLLPSGTAVVEVPVGGPIAIPRRARFLADLMPIEDAPGGHLSYLRQTVRTNNAAVVAEASIKPTSVFTLERIDDTTDVVAHLSEPLPRSYFDDSGKIVQFIQTEMRLGVDLAVDAKIVSDILTTPGILVEGDIGTTLDTTRRSLTRLQEREVEPTAWVLHPRDWEQIEAEIITGFAANSNIASPTDVVRRQLWGIPVVVSNAMTENTGLLGDFGEAALYRTDGIRIDWSEATYDSGAGATDFERNLLRWRAEGRFQTAVYRPFAFVEINLAATGS